ncbi:MAG: NDP-sugar synthase [Dehalococcoidia bacterium]|nr:NDP-sugar synthase [Dehalococcoidia bacterium]
MKAVILVGGLGTRLRPLTLHTPKSMVPVLNVPFLEHVLKRLTDYGVREAVLALSHLAPAVESYFGDGRALGMDLKYVVEPSPLGTAGAARNALGHIREACLIMNGDIFTGLDIATMQESHKAHRAKVSIALTAVDNPCAYGLVETNKDGRVRRFLEKPSAQEVTTNLINAGTYIVEPDVLSAIPADTVMSFERDVFPALLTRGKPIFSFADTSYWMDIGTPAKYHQLNRDLLYKRAFSSPGGQAVHNQPEIHPTARLQGPVLLGDGCCIGEGVVISGPTVIGPQCRLEAGAIVSDAIIWHNVAVGAGGSIEGSVVGHNCTLGSGTRLSDCIVGDHIVLPRDYCQTGGQIWPGLA